MLTYGCLTSIVLAIILFAVILPPRMKDAEEPSKTTPSQSGPRVWTPEELTGKKIPDSTTPRKHFVYAKSVVNIRKGPGKNHSVVGKTHPGEKLEYMSRSGDWFKLVPDGEKKERYIHNSIVLSQLEKDTRDRAQIALLNWSWQENYGYAVAEGKVKNVSSGTLENVQVVVSYETAGGDFITSDSTLIEYTTLLPGQTSPFKSMARWNPAMKKASLSFKTLFGNKLIAYKE